MRLNRPIPLSAASSANLATTASSGGGVNAVLNFTASTNGTRWVLENVVVSYTTVSTGGGLNVYNGTSSGALMAAVDILQEGITAIDFSVGAPAGNALAVELLQAGSSIVGRLNAYTRLS